MEFMNCVITEKGRALLEKTPTGIYGIEFTRAEVGDGIYGAEVLDTLEKRTELLSVKERLYSSPNRL